MRTRLLVLLAPLALAAPAAAQTLSECEIDGRPQVVSGPPAEGCTPLDPSALALGDAGYEALARRLDAQQDEIERLSRQLRALSQRTVVQPQPIAPARAGPSLGTDRPITDTEERRRALDQDLRRKLDDLR